ncbi:MAG: HAD family phosphatase [Prevotellaceae bacterium]|jgi:putative hydrolase of the HAD superfamily|nr:HAD family phosphatase [Prevotellaceae bacterium]
MIDNNIKNLIIDFGGVLIDLDRRRCLDNFTKLGLPDVEVMLNEYHQQDFFLQHEQGVISSAAFRDEIRKRIGRQVSDRQIDDAWNSFLVGIPAYKLDCLLKLRTRYVVYLLSNTNAIHWQWACRHAFRYKGFRAEDFFEHIYLSYEMKLAKPDPAIFRQVLDETGIAPAQTLFIDDSIANCRTAEALGIRTYTPKAGEDWSHLFEAP